jgi:hypothetical protein
VDDPHNYYNEEFLNTLTPNGLPPHVLKLKIGCPVILLRSIDPTNRLCNDIRLMIRGFQKNTIDTQIVLGQHAGVFSALHTLYAQWTMRCSLFNLSESSSLFGLASQ